MIANQDKNYFFVVTPSFNQARFIQQTIESVLRQAGSTTVYWVVDGKSTDHSQEILKKYGKDINWLSEQDQGQTDALNKGINCLRLYAKQHRLSDEKIFFAYINSDDYYLPDAFAKVEQAFGAHPEVMWLVGDCQIVNAENRLIQQPIRWYKKVLRSANISWLLYILNPIPQPAVFLRWTAVQKVGVFNKELKYTMDYEYWLRVQNQFGLPLLLSQPLAAFRIHGQSKGGTAFLAQFAEQYQVAQRFTKNGLLLLLHQLHNGLITTIYKVLK